MPDVDQTLTFGNPTDTQSILTIDINIDETLTFDTPTLDDDFSGATVTITVSNSKAIITIDVNSDGEVIFETPEFDFEFVGQIVIARTVEFGFNRGLRILDQQRQPIIFSSRPDLETIVSPGTDTDIILNLDFDGADGATTTTDSSYYAHPVQLGLNPNNLLEISTEQSRYGPSSFKRFYTGGSGGAFVDNYIIINPNDNTGAANNNSGTDLFMFNTDMTIECFVWIDNIVDRVGIFWRGGTIVSVGPDDAVHFYIEKHPTLDTCRLLVRTRQALGATTELLTDYFTITYSVWHHYAFSRASGTAQTKIYFDNALKATGTTSATPSGTFSSYDIYIGAAQTENFSVYYDRYRVTRAVLSPGEFSYREMPVIFRSRTNSNPIKFNSISGIDVNINQDAQFPRLTFPNEDFEEGTPDINVTHNLGGVNFENEFSNSVTFDSTTGLQFLINGQLVVFLNPNTLSVNLPAPTIDFGNEIVSVGVLSLTTNPITPVVQQDTTISVGVLSITANGIGPTFAGDDTFEAEVLSLTVNLNAPTVSTDQNVVFSAGVLSLTANAINPAVVSDVNFASGVLSLTANSLAPSISGSANVSTGVLSITASQQAPAVLTDVLITQSALSITTSTQAPTVSTGGGEDVTVSVEVLSSTVSLYEFSTPALLTITLPTPTISAEIGGDVIVEVGVLSLTGSAVTPSIITDANFSTGVLSLTANGISPTVSGDANISLASLSSVASVQSLTVSAQMQVNVSAGVLSITVNTYEFSRPAFITITQPTPTVVIS